MTEMRKRVNRATLAGVLLAALGTPGLSEPVPVGEEGELGKLLPSVAGEKVCLRMTIGGGDEEIDTHELMPGTDDKVFRLDKVDVAECRSMDDGADGGSMQ
jgi:hypothetical protein